MSVPGKLEVNIKINTLPHYVQLVKNDWREFVVNAEGQMIKMRIRPKAWEKIEQAAAEYPSWVASITGKMGQRIKNGFVLLQPAVQVYERKDNFSATEKEDVPPKTE